MTSGEPGAPFNAAGFKPANREQRFALALRYLLKELLAMAYMRFPGEAGQRLYNGIRESLDLLRNALVVREMQGEDRRDAELQLITFLANAAHGGDADVRKRMGQNRYEFWRRLSRNNGDMFRLKLSEEPLRVDVETEGGVLPLDLGYAEGYTMVIPFTPEGFDDYFRRGISGFDFGPRHIVSEDQRPGPNTPCYVLIGAIIHFASLANSEAYAGGVEAFHCQRALKTSQRGALENQPF